MIRRAAAALLAALALAGCGQSGEPTRDPLSWQEGPRLFVPPTLPGDRILRGEVRNGSDDTIIVDASDIKLLDARGRRVKASATFVAAYAHPLFPYDKSPNPYPPQERRRLGYVAELEPGKSAPLTISWHEPGGARTPVRVDYGLGTLELPRAARLVPR